MIETRARLHLGHRGTQLTGIGGGLPGRHSVPHAVRHSLRAVVLGVTDVVFTMVRRAAAGSVAPAGTCPRAQPVAPYEHPGVRLSNDNDCCPASQAPR